MNSPLYRAILDDPDNDTPRLVYADWLEERGDPARAELIRLQIARACDPRSQTPGGDRRESELLSEHGERWAEELPELPDTLVWGSYRRGFMGEICSASVSAVLTHEHLFHLVPIEALSLYTWSDDGTLRGSSLLDRIREVALGRNLFVAGEAEIDDRAFAHAMTWVDEAQTRRLYIDALLLSREGVRPLREATLGHLESLRWRCYPRGDVLLGASLGSPWWRELRELILEGHQIDAPGVEALCRGLGEGLRDLSIESAGLERASAERLAASGCLARLSSLSLTGNQIDAAAARTLLAALPPDSRLDLYANPLGDEGAALLCEATQLSHSDTFSPGPAGGIGDDGAIAVAGSASASRFKRMMLGGQHLGPRGVEALFRSPHLSQLAFIDLSNNTLARLPPSELPSLGQLTARACSLTDAGIVDFCERSRLPVLAHLDLSTNQLGPRAARAIASASGLPSLTTLDLSGNPLSEEGLIELLSGGLPSLRHLTVRDCEITSADPLRWLSLTKIAQLSTLWLYSRGNRIPDAPYRELQAAAHALGCTIDHYRPPQAGDPLGLVTGLGHGPLSAPSRRMLGRYLSTLWFREYATCGWLKLAEISALQPQSHRPRHARLLSLFRSGDRSPETVRLVIELFSGSWLPGYIPESVCGWDRAGEDLPAASREEARAIAREIADRSGQNRIEGVRPPTEPGRIPRTEAIAYRELPDWFDALFSEEALFYRGSGPAVIGLDAEHIGMFWLE